MAMAVSTLLKHGATCAGKTVMDEFGFSVIGENAHYGAPTNPKEPSQIPGGSSSGSAVAVAGELVDFALGTDTVGCIRVAAACCGILGFRPSHGAISTIGVLPISQSLDVVGWFARDPLTLRLVGLALLPMKPLELRRSRRFVFADDCFKLAKVPKQKSVHVVEQAIEKLSGYQSPKHLNLGQHVAACVPALKGLSEASEVGQEESSTLMDLALAMLSIERHEFCINFEQWINKAKPSLGSSISNQVLSAINTTNDDIKCLYKIRTEMRAALNGLLQDGGVLVVPTLSDPPLKLNSRKKVKDQFENSVFVLSSIAGLSGCCQVTIPLGTHEGYPISVSFIASHGEDRFLLDVVAEMYSTLQVEANSAASGQHLADTDSDVDIAEVFKEKGNAAFKGRQWNKAVDFYTDAIKLNSQVATYYSNRAAAYLELGFFQQAESDCSQAILLDKKNVKAYLRRGTAREMLLHYKDAIEDFKHALVLEPQNKAAVNGEKRNRKLMC